MIRLSHTRPLLLAACAAGLWIATTGSWSADAPRLRARRLAVRPAAPAGAASTHSTGQSGSAAPAATRTISPPPLPVCAYLDTLQRLRGAAPRTRAVGEASRDLAALLAADARLLARHGDAIRRAVQPEASLLIQLLGQVGTPAAQQLLCELFAARDLDQTCRLMAVIALAQTDRPTRQSAEALAQLIQSSPPVRLASSARLILGHVAGRLADPAAQARALRCLADGLGARPTLQQQSVYLEALGNLGTPAVFLRIRPYLRAKDSRVRRHAVEALRGLRGPAAHAALAQALTEDPAAQVRQASVRILVRADRDADLPLLARVIRIDLCPRVRIAALSYMARRLGRVTQARTALVAVLARDTSAEVRAHAAVLLSR